MNPTAFILNGGDALPPSTLLGCLALLFSTLPTPSDFLLLLHALLKNFHSAPLTPH